MYLSHMKIDVLFFALILLVLAGCNDSEEDSDTISTLRLITHNVFYGFTKVPDRKETWLEWMDNQHPDVVVLQELNEYTPDQLAEDAAAWNHSYSVLLKEEGFPTGITSRYVIEDVQRYVDGFHHGVIRAKIRDIYFYVIHLHPSNWEVRHREIDQILNNIEELPEGSPVVLAGDFNTFSPYDSLFYAHGRLEPFFAERDGTFTENNLNNNKLDYGVIQKLLDEDFLDLEYSKRNDRYEFPGTFPTLIPKEGEHGDLRRLDYVFTNKDFPGECKEASIIVNDTTQYVSDHLPIMVDWEF